MLRLAQCRLKVKFVTLRLHAHGWAFGCCTNAVLVSLGHRRSTNFHFIGPPPMVPTQFRSSEETATVFYQCKKCHHEDTEKEKRQQPSSQDRTYVSGTPKAGALRRGVDVSSYTFAFVVARDAWPELRLLPHLTHAQTNPTMTARTTRMAIVRNR